MTTDGVLTCSNRHSKNIQTLLRFTSNAEPSGCEAPVQPLYHRAVVECLSTFLIANVTFRLLF